MGKSRLQREKAKHRAGLQKRLEQNNIRSGKRERENRLVFEKQFEEFVKRLR